MLRILNMKKEAITTMTPTKIPHRLAENQMPPKKPTKGRDFRSAVSIRQTVGAEPPCKKALFDSDEEREVIKPWDSGPTREWLTSALRTWGESRATPETHTAFMLLGDFDGNGNGNDDEADKDMSKGTPMTLTRFKIAQQFCTAVGDKMGCKHRVQFLDITSTYLGRIDMMMAVHKQDVEDMDASKIAGRLVNAEAYYAGEGEAEWDKEFIAKRSEWLDGGLTADCIAVYRRGDIDMAEKLQALIKKEEAHPMKYKCGFDKADLGDGDKGADMWKSILRVLDIPVDRHKCIPFALNSDSSSFHWIGKDIEIMTEHNPLTGEAFDKKASSDSRIGFAGYVGVRCMTKTKRDLVLTLFASMPNIFGGESEDSLEYIGFHGCGDSDGGEKRKREEADKKDIKTKTTEASPVRFKRRKLNKIRETTFTIEINKGVMIDVRDYPDGWNYRLIDHDAEEEMSVKTKDLMKLSKTDLIMHLLISMQTKLPGDYTKVLDEFCDYADQGSQGELWAMMPTPEQLAEHTNVSEMTCFIKDHFSKEAIVEYIMDKHGESALDVGKRLEACLRPVIRVTTT